MYLCAVLQPIAWSFWLLLVSYGTLARLQSRLWLKRAAQPLVLVQETLLLPCIHTATAVPKRPACQGVRSIARQHSPSTVYAAAALSPRMPRLLCVALIAATAAAFDVSWIPADPDGPLPPSIVEKLPVIEKLCAKLEASSGSGSSLVNRLRLVGVVAAGAWAWHSYQSKGLVWDATRAARSRSSLSPRPLSPRPPAPSKSSLFDPGAL